MEPKPVRECNTPSYPTRREMLAGAATFALASFAGCWRVLGETAQGKAIVAPVFEHGTGRGATGCVVVSPPVFLSEEEAMQIIREELAKHGIRLKGDHILEGVRIFPRVLRASVKDKGHTEEELDPENDPDLKNQFHPKPLKLDGVDSDKKVAVEFISRLDCSDFGRVLHDGTSCISDGMLLYSYSSVRRYDFVDVAKYVAMKVEKESKDCVYFGVFYDPVGRPPNPDHSTENGEVDWKAVRKKRDEEAKEDAKEESRGLLRKQVQDFAGWLKEKKVVP